MHLIYEALKKTGGNTDADTVVGAMKGMTWESPRGPISIDPRTRDIVQNVYIRKVEKVDGEPWADRIRDLPGGGRIRSRKRPRIKLWVFAQNRGRDAIGKPVLLPSGEKDRMRASESEYFLRRPPPSL